jgi:phage terminase Nu1 subunit (DNA packaging protein)
MNQDTQDHDIGLLKRWPALGLPCTQQQLADLVGITQSAISRHITAGHIPSSATALEQLRTYLAHLAAEAARQRGDGLLSLPAERAALARAQREMVELKNAAALAEYAPTALLREVLATVSAAMVAHIDQLAGQIDQAAPDLPESARATVLAIIASARAKWIRSTSGLVDRSLPEQQDDQEEGPLDEVDGNEA